MYNGFGRNNKTGGLFDYNEIKLIHIKEEIENKKKYIFDNGIQDEMEDVMNNLEYIYKRIRNLDLHVSGSINSNTFKNNINKYKKNWG